MTIRGNRIECRADDILMDYSKFEDCLMCGGVHLKGDHVVSDCGMDICATEPPCDFHGDGEPEDYDDEQD